jgi:hypothetical protein
MRYAAVTFLLVVLTPFAVRAQSPDPAQTEERKPLPIKGGTVTYTLPESWHRLPNEFASVVGLGTAGLLQLTLLYPVEEGKEPTVLYPAEKVEESGEERKVVARITLSATTQEYRSLKEMWNSRPPRPLDFVILSDVFHGDNWRTLVTKGIYYGEPYVSLSCAGLVNKQYTGLDVMLYTDGRDPEPFRRAVADFNAVCESLKIDGKNQLDTKLNADKILELLAAGAKK